MKSTMMAVPLSTNTMFARMDKLFGQSEVISRLPDKRLVRHSVTEIAARTRALAHALKELGIKKGDCVATLCWNHNVHLECYFGIPLAGAVMHTLNLRLSGEEIAWIAGHAKDRVLIVDDISAVPLPPSRGALSLRKSHRVPVRRRADPGRLRELRNADR